MIEATSTLCFCVVRGRWARDDYDDKEVPTHTPASMPSMQQHQMVWDMQKETKAPRQRAADRRTPPSACDGASCGGGKQGYFSRRFKNARQMCLHARSSPALAWHARGCWTCTLR